MDAVADVAVALRRYLAAHPDACDTLQWITAWWLPPQWSGVRREVVREAVAQLVAGGEMESWSGLDGQTVYRAVPRALPDDGPAAAPLRV
jgi:hypothetical protein